MTNNCLRNGLSITHAVNTLVENCQFNNSRGHLPQSGVDIEPNNQYNNVSGITLRNCTASGNEGSGFIVSLHALDATSSPVDITIENCSVQNSIGGMGFWISLGDHAIAGTVQLTDCTTSGSAKYALGIQATNAGVQADVLVTNCLFQDGRNADSCPPILLEVPAFDPNAPIPITAGRVELNACTLRDDTTRCPILTRHGSPQVCPGPPAGGILNVHGSLVAKYTAPPPADCPYPELPNLSIDYQLVPSGP